jgi:hypothetical protein
MTMFRQFVSTGLSSESDIVGFRSSRDIRCYVGRTLSDNHRHLINACAFNFENGG